MSSCVITCLLHISAKPGARPASMPLFCRKNLTSQNEWSKSQGVVSWCANERVAFHNSLFWRWFVRTASVLEGRAQAFFKPSHSEKDQHRQRHPIFVVLLCYSRLIPDQSQRSSCLNTLRNSSRTSIRANPNKLCPLHRCGSRTSGDSGANPVPQTLSES